MKWMLVSDWPVGQFCIPSGTTLTGPAPTWNGLALPTPLPINTRPLDAEGLSMMRSWYRSDEERRWFVEKGF
jgi:hypothetical protein